MQHSAKNFSTLDRWITLFDQALKTTQVSAAYASERPSPAEKLDNETMSDKQNAHAAALMRVNHTGEVCAQALYQGQSLTAKLENVRQDMQQAAKEEIDHLVWCHQRLDELNAKTSRLNPLFYAASFSVGALAGAINDKTSLGFVAATEELVCEHLESHLEKLPKADKKSRAIVQSMISDEKEHADKALAAGGKPFSRPTKQLMKVLARIMTKSTYYL